MIFVADFLIFGVTLAVFYMGGLFTRTGMTWYASLKKPAMTPPSWVFSVAWTVIYVCAALCASLVWRTFERDWWFLAIITLFGINAVLNVLWTYLFFVRHRALYALVDAVALFVVTWTLIIAVAPSVVCAALLLPYGLWLIGAICLNWQFMVINGL